MVGWHQGAPMGQLSTRSAKETYPKGDGRHSFGGCFVPQDHSGDCRKEVCHPALVGEGLWPQTGKVSPACTQGEKHSGVFMVTPPYSGSPVTTTKLSFFYPAHARALILGSSICHTSSIDAWEETRHLLRGPGPCPLGWPVFKCPLHLHPGADLHGCTALSGVTLRGYKGAIKGFYSIFSTHCGKSFQEISDVLAQSLPGSPTAVCQALGRI